MPSSHIKVSYALALLLAAATPAFARPRPDDYRAVGVSLPEHAHVPLQIFVKDEDGVPHRLKDIVSLTTVLLLSDFNCRTLCGPAVAFVAGAVIGLLLPVSRVEADWMGETGGTLRQQAGQMGRDAVDRARDVAERSVDAAVTAAKEATAAAGNVAEKTGEETKKAVDESKG